LLVIGGRIVHVGPDPRSIEPCTHSLSVLENGNGKVGDAVFAGACDKSAHVCRERVGVPRDDPSSPCVRVIEAVQTDPEHGGLKLVEPRVPRAGSRDVVLAIPAVLPQEAHSHGHVVIVRRHRATIPKRGEILCRVEAERGRVAEGAGATSVPPCARSLCAVLHDAYPSVAAERHDPLDVCEKSIQVRDDDGSGVG
jgi:hypothetical protein